MNKEQEIKDICKLICATCAQFDGCAINCKAHRDTAEILYNAGYRKIDENCAVITQAELKEYKKQAVKDVLESLKEAGNGVYPEYIPDIIEELQEQAVKKFAQKIKDGVADYLYKTNFDGRKDNVVDMFELCEIIDELLKEYEK